MRTLSPATSTPVDPKTLAWAYNAASLKEQTGPKSNASFVASVEQMEAFAADPAAWRPEITNQVERVRTLGQASASASYHAQVTNTESVERFKAALSGIKDALVGQIDSAKSISDTFATTRANDIQATRESINTMLTEAITGGADSLSAARKELLGDWKRGQVNRKSNDYFSDANINQIESYIQDISMEDHVYYLSGAFSEALENLANTRDAGLLVSHLDTLEGLAAKARDALMVHAAGYELPGFEDPRGQNALATDATIASNMSRQEVLKAAGIKFTGPASSAHPLGE